MTRGKPSHGFTLVEMAIVIVISGTMLTGLLGLALNVQERNRFNTTLQHMEAIQKALFQFAQTYEYLPCPANPIAVINANDFGVGVKNPATTDPRLAAGPGNATTCNALNLVSYTAVRKGMVPITTLNLPPDYAFDGWGNRITYLVDERLTYREGTTVNDGRGFADYGLANQAQQQASGGAITYSPNTTGNRDIQSMAAAVISHGANGSGAYRARLPAVGAAPRATLATSPAHESAQDWNAGAAANITITGNNNRENGGFDDIVYPIPRWRILGNKHGNAMPYTANTGANPPPYRFSIIGAGNNVRW